MKRPGTLTLLLATAALAACDPKARSAVDSPTADVQAPAARDSATPDSTKPDSAAPDSTRPDSTRPDSAAGTPTR